MFIIRRTVEQDEYIWEDSDPSEASEPPEDFIPNYWPTPESPVPPAPAPPIPSSHTPAPADPPPPAPRPDPPAESQAKPQDHNGITRRCWKSHPGMPPEPYLQNDDSSDEPPALCEDNSDSDAETEAELPADAKVRAHATPPDTHPTSPSPPASEHSLTRSQLDAHYDEAYEGKHGSTTPTMTPSTT